MSKDLREVRELVSQASKGRVFQEEKTARVRAQQSSQSDWNRMSKEGYSRRGGDQSSVPVFIDPSKHFVESL